MSALLESNAGVQDLQVLLQASLDKSIHIIHHSKSLEEVKREIELLVELLKPTNFSEDFSTSSDALESKPTLSSAYSAKDFLRLQSLFLASGQKMRLLRSVLTVVLVSWSPAFSERERPSLLYPWLDHLPAMDVLYALSEVLHELSVESSPNSSSSSLSPIAASTRVAHAHELSGLILRFFGLSTSHGEAALPKIVAEISRGVADAKREAVWARMLALVCQVPDRMFNVLKRHTDERYTAEKWFFSLSQPFEKCLETLSLTSPFPFYSLWLSKLASIGRLASALRALDPMRFIESSPTAASCLSDVFAQIAPNAVEHLVFGLLLAPTSSKRRHLQAFLRNTVSKLFEVSTTARFVFSEKVLAAASLPFWILKQVLLFVHDWCLRTENLAYWRELVQRMGARAGNEKFIKMEPYERQRRLNRMMVLILRDNLISREEAENTEVLDGLLAAVQTLLQDPRESIATLGIRIARAYTIFIDPSNPPPFEEPPLPEDEEPEEEPIAPNSTQVPGSNPAEGETLLEDSEKSVSEFLDPDEPWMSFLDRHYALNSGIGSGSDKSSRGFRKGKFFQVGLEDDLSDVSEVKTPLYLRDCMTYLKSDDPKSLEVVLRVLAPLIASRPSDLPELAVSVASTLLHVMNNYELENFDQEKLEALATLVEVSPLQVLPFLVNEFFARNYSLHERFVMLDALCEGAQRLAEHKVDTPAEFNPIAPKRHLKLEKKPTVDPNAPKIQFLATGSNASIQLDEKDKTPAKSRRWASERKHAATFQNRFAPHVDTLLGLFDFEKIRATSYDSKQMSPLQLLLTEPRLLGKLIYVVSVFLDCAGVSNPVFEKCARRVLEVVWQFRNHEDPFVRRALLLSVSALFRTAPAWVLFEACLQEMNELVAWLQTNGEEDTDEEVRVLCGAALFQLSKLQRQNPQYKPLGAEV